MKQQSDYWPDDVPTIPEDDSPDNKQFAILIVTVIMLVLGMAVWYKANH